MSRSLLPLVLLGLLLPAGGAQASTITTTDYAVTIAGTAAYNRADVDDDVTAQHDIDLAFRTEIPKLTFFEDVAEDSQGASGTASVTRGSYVITGESGQVRCTSHDLAGVTGGGLDATRGPQGTTFATRVIDAFTVNIGGCPEPMSGWQFPFGSGGEEVGIGIFDGAFVLPHERIGEEVLEFPLKGEVTGSSCPFNHVNTALCSLTWEATVRFVRTGTGEEELEVPDVPIVPPPPAPAATPAPGPASTPAPPPLPDEDLLVPLVKPDPVVPVLARAALARGLGSASLPLTCSASCRGTVTATAAGRTLAKVTFRAPAGRTVTARLRFDAADRRAIRRAGRVRLTVRATAGGKAIRRTATLRRR